MARIGIGMAAAALLLLGGWAQPGEAPSADAGPSPDLTIREQEPTDQRLERLLKKPVLDGSHAPPPAAIPAPPSAPAERPSRWTRRPTDSDFDSLYPKRAARLEVEGRATVVCVIGLDESVRDCVVQSETPAGYGFGAAAASLAQRGRIAPPTQGGKPREARITIPFVFNMRKAAPPPPITRPPPLALDRARPGPAVAAGETGARAEAEPRPPRPPVDLSWVAPNLLATVVGTLVFLALAAMTALLTTRRGDTRRA
jgi:TonB family protein